MHRLAVALRASRVASVPLRSSVSYASRAKFSTSLSGVQSFKTVRGGNVARGLSMRAAMRASRVRAAGVHSQAGVLNNSAAAAAAASSASVKVPISLVKALRERTNAPIKECKDVLAYLVTDPDVEGGTLSLDADEGELMAAGDRELRKRGVTTAAKKAGRSAAEGLVCVAQNEDGSAAAMIEINSETDFAAKTEAFQQLCTRVAHAVLSNAEGELNAEQLGQLPLHDDASKTVGDSVVELVASIRENIQLRRAVVHSAAGDNQALAFYVHNTLGPVQNGAQAGKMASIVKLEATEPVNELNKLCRSLAMHVVAEKPSFTTEADVPEERLEEERSILRERIEKEGKGNSPHVDKMISGRLGKFYQEHVFENQLYTMDDDPKPVSVSKFLAKQPGTPHVVDYSYFGVGEGIEVSSTDDFAEEVARLAGHK